MKRDLSILCSWIIRYVHVLIVFILFPLFVYAYGSVSSKEESTGMVSDPVSSMVRYSGASRILSQQEATYLENINNNISNNWLSDIDSKYELRISSNNSFSEYYNDDKFGWGEWRVYSATSTASSSRIIDGTKPMYIVDSNNVHKFYLERTQYDPDSKGENYVYEIYFVDPIKLILTRVDNNKVLSFVRTTIATSTKTKKSPR